jgi:hypothetical protein
VTSDQIKQTPHYDLSVTHWLKEIAFQLAVSNEKPAPQVQKPPFQPHQKGR